MNKSIKYAKNGAIIFGLGNGVLNIINQLNGMSENPDLKFNWIEFLAAIGKGAAVGGLGGLSIGWLVDYNNLRQKPIDTDAYLTGLINNIRLDKVDPNYKLLENQVNRLCSDLMLHYDDKIDGRPEKHGSTEKGTALTNGFDIDVALKFKPNSFLSTSEMFHDLGKYLENKVGEYGVYKTRSQNKSIGVYLKIRGEEYKIDFAPYKATKRSKTSGYLFVNDKSFFLDNSSIKKTDIKALKRNKLTEVQKKIVIVLKNWKNQNELPLPSHLLEYLVIDAYNYNYGRVPKSISKKAIMVLKHITDNLEFAYIQGVENTNNILTDIAQDKKDQIIGACRSAVKEYEYQPNSIASIFRERKNEGLSW